MNLLLNNGEIINGKELFKSALSIGKCIDELIPKKDKKYENFILWNHIKNKTPQLLIAEYKYISNINDTIIDEETDTFIKTYGNKIYSHNFLDNDDINIFTNCNLYNNSELVNNYNIQLKIICHITYLINEICYKLKHNKLDNYTINLKLYYVDFNVKSNELLKGKTIALLYNVINDCFSKNVNYLIVDGDMNSYTKYISTILFFELYRNIKTIEITTIGQGVIKHCKYCGELFYNKRDNTKCCGSYECKRLRNNFDSKKSKEKKKNLLTLN